MQTNIEQQYRTLLVLWFSFLMSQFIFLVVIYFAEPNLFKFDFSQNLFHPMALIIGFMAVMNLGLSFLFRSNYLNDAVEKQNPQIVQTGLILAWAFCESIVIFGLVLAFSIKYPLFLAFFALGIIGFILHFPRRIWLIDASYKQNKSEI
jgi:F0F1-type ATP synthase membrane subunit c/vacuolar-type H+-ATPase subunit K